MDQPLPVMLYTGLSAHVEGYAKKDHAFPVVSLLGTKGATQGIAAALIGRKEKVFLSQGSGPQEVRLLHGEHRIFGKTLPCGAHHLLVIHTSALLAQCALPSFILIGRPEKKERMRLAYLSFLDRLVPVPLLPAWADRLWEKGVERGEIKALEGFRLTAYECRVELEVLKKDLSRAISEKVLTLEEDRNEAGRESQGGVLSDADHGD